MKHTVVLDVESYANWFLVAMKNVDTQEVVTVECVDGPLSTPDRELLRDIVENDLCITFNGNNYDMPVVWAAIAGRTAVELQAITHAIIVENLRTWEVERAWKFRTRSTDHIDLIEVAPLDASLKIYNGRLHGQRMQDLPFEPGSRLTTEQQTIVRDYCVNDLAATELLLSALAEPLALRDEMSIEYRQDLRSKSDAQIAEAVIIRELEKAIGKRFSKPDTLPGTTYRYNPPDYIRYSTPQFQAMLDAVKNAKYVVGINGKVAIPAEITSLELRLGNTSYNMGNGGLHSCELQSAHVADENTLIRDFDVTSYYPRLILNSGIYPKHIGPEFLDIYRSIVERRVSAKKAGNKVEAESLKVTANGTFGLLGSGHSKLGSPDLMIQVTVTGQLALLMLIERAELAGIPVISGNTDGVVFKCPRDLEPKLLEVVQQWEADTGFVTEETRYKGLYSANVNNYIAIKEDGSHKGKGWFFNPWEGSKPDYRGQLSKNPQTTVCVSAVVAYLTNGTPLADTIRACSDIRQFVTVRKVNGGAVWQGQYLGKAVRWYYAKGQFEPIRYASNGNRVSKSDGAMPCMELPDALPADIDYDWYEREAASMLVDIGAVQGPRRRGEPDERQVDLFGSLEEVA